MLEEIALRNAQPHCELEPAALALLGENSWPGNVRELGNVLEKAVLMSENQRLSVADIAAVLPPGQKQALPAARGSSAAVVPYAQAMAEAELRILRDALDACDGRASEAARRLGIGRATFYRRLALLGETPKK
jgi:DNA-binding NtrC family response regulator